MTTTASTRLLLVIMFAVSCGFAAYRCCIVSAPDTFDQRLAELAGPDAQMLGHYTGWSADLETKMADAYRNRQPFWARSERQYRNVHNLKETWNVSEGFVLTHDRRLFQIDRYAPTMFGNERVNCNEIPDPKVYTRVDGTYYLGMYGKTHVDLDSCSLNGCTLLRLQSPLRRRSKQRHFLC